MDREFPKLFLYLGDVKFAETWVGGGKIPINLASSYKSDTRGGVMTPDENLIYAFARPVEEYQNVIAFSPSVQIHNLTIVGCSVDGRPLSNEYGASRYVEDGLILSFCQTASYEIMQRLGKVCCVQVIQPDLLLNSIEAQLGPVSKVGPCRYTSDHRRNHFLKSDEDSWQDEFRFFWKKTDEPTVWVDIPPVAEHLAL
ncbi:hypothetical protein [Achromobacter aegrifaciens]|uniref:hypothetical protein n=1 Tax=Achromobacter aegrifaciens TaxID=1287736 RepID=UPI000F7376DA|nr:hypothetical protein [Achromobacter aegrifaciens]RSE91753.1 hypothetical protein EGU54_30365 [Achromobacter aegrifaciens]